MSKLLTISIPTWNRAKLLDDLLNSLCNDLKKYKLDTRVQIVVSNNASDDNTEQVVSKYSSLHNFISYNKNTINIGAKSNVLKSMELANTPFVFFIGDDDKLNVASLSFILDILENNNDVGLLLDSSKSKFQFRDELKKIELPQLTEHFFWYMGNAGFFIVRSNYIKDGLSEYGYDFFNECWPQTQLTLIGLSKQKDHRCYVGDFSIPAESSHGEVMVYSSFYLWRTVIYDLRMSIEALKGIIAPEVYQGALNNMKKSVKQNVLNILQCGVFVDETEARKKTLAHIRQHQHYFKGSEKYAYLLVAFVLSLPQAISKTLSNIFIFLIRGKHGINKKNKFVIAELAKKTEQKKNKESIRTLEFEK